MTDAKTRPISFRVETDVLDALEEMGISPTEFSKEALRREARRARQMAALQRLKKVALRGDPGFDAVAFIRKDRDTR